MKTLYLSLLMCATTAMASSFHGNPNPERFEVLEDSKTSDQSESDAKVDLSKPREWTSIQGRTFTGVLVSRSGGMVKIKEIENDRVYTLLLVQLIPEHRKLIEANTDP